MLRNRDLRAVITCAQALEDIVDSAQFYAAVLPLLRGLVAADVASFNVIDVGARRSERPIVDPPDAYWEAPADVLGRYAHQNPLVSAGRLDAIKFSDYITRRELHRLEIYDLIYAPMSVEHQMAFTVPAPRPKVVVGLALSRLRPDFSERDRSVLNSIRPFVQHAYARVTRHPQLLPAEALGLTRRQAEILERLARGQSSIQIAHALHISERTVHKHLEHIYRRLEVPSRAAAVARGLGLG